MTRGKKEEGRRKKEEGRRKKEEGMTVCGRQLEGSCDPAASSDRRQPKVKPLISLAWQGSTVHTRHSIGHCCAAKFTLHLRHHMA